MMLDNEDLAFLVFDLTATSRRVAVSSGSTQSRHMSGSVQPDCHVCIS